jgi:predicted secreted protein
MTGEILGRGVKLRVNGSVIICFKSMTLTHNGELIDITDSCSNGYRELAFDPAIKSIDLAVEAIMKQKLFREAVFSGTAGAMAFQDAEIVFPHSNGSGADGDIVSGTFVISAYSESIPHDNVVTYSATLQSSGEYTYTPEV